MAGDKVAQLMKAGTGGVLEQIIIRAEKDRFHGGIISNHGQYDIRLCGNLGKGGAWAQPSSLASEAAASGLHHSRN